jgi:hypothetical protein
MCDLTCIWKENLPLFNFIQKSENCIIYVIIKKYDFKCSMSTNKQQERNIETFVRSQKLFFENLKILIKKNLKLRLYFFWVASSGYMNYKP